jgi:hypothetical protein
MLDMPHRLMLIRPGVGAEPTVRRDADRTRPQRSGRAITWRVLDPDPLVVLSEADLVGRSFPYCYRIKMAFPLAVHTSVHRAAGIGSAERRSSLPGEHIALDAEALSWHSGLTLDYLHRGGSPAVQSSAIRARSNRQTRRRAA